MARNRTRFVRPPARSMIWIGAGVDIQTVVGNTPLLFSSFSAAALLLLPFTIIRQRLLIYYSTDQAAVSEQVRGAVGCIVVKAQASSLGITALSDSIADPSAEWMWYQPLEHKFIFLDSTSFQSGASSQYEIDVRSMRKVAINEDVVTVVANRNNIGSQVGVEGRMLVKLH